MNARFQIFELSLEGRQVEEAVASIFHTLIFHRSLGKFHYKQEASYSVGSVGYEDVDCDFVDFTYVRCASDELDRNLKKEILAYCDALRNPEGNRSGQISLEFYQKKKGRWLFPVESIPWEVWTIKTNLISLNNEQEKQICREKVGELLAEKIMYIAEYMNRQEYVPKMPNESEVDLVFDIGYEDVQPYLFKISHQITGLSSSSVSVSMKKLIKDTLAL